MKLKVLGSSAGGRFPQWNCNCFNCDGARRGTVNALRRTQSSIALSENGDDWLLVNASPDILAQIEASPELQPTRWARDTGIAAVLLTDAQIDHVTGLLMLRENAGSLPIYTTEAVWEDLNAGFPLARILGHYCGVEHRLLDANGSAFRLPAFDNTYVLPLPLFSKAPPYSPHRHATVAGDNIGLLIENSATGKKAFYAPGLGALEPHVLDAMHGADVLLVDGTLWTQNEMIELGLSKKTGAEMGHLAQTGPGGMIEVFDSIKRAGVRKVLIHINNTNPILIEDGPERRILAEHGIEVAFDGMTFEL